MRTHKFEPEPSLTLPRMLGLNIENHFMLPCRGVAEAPYRGRT